MTILLVTLLLHFYTPSAHDITGIWLNPEKTRSIRIFEQNGKFYGIMHWIGEPEPKLKKGQLVLKNLVFEGGYFKNGQAYTPAYGWVACEARITNRQLHLTGHKFGIARTRIFLQGSN
jgi:hypothetical protein